MKVLEHISNEHRGTAISEVVLYKTLCVIDHVCEGKEEFDINLIPLTSGNGTEITE